ncbi:Spy0128 family protein [Parasporobacterium paucivorans]|uniref:Pilin isopeptide linkage domain-containing protein n=1 Tax=Parasporobacterium paucivorans DSM 15970 TaxID=1122934 RepID=A0A1M6IZS6_9FIRM|nr:FctA domain-containing protein [Parasporobacterium paucivorans]SHJ39931.1 pilin isopeptide linkage domain-containing protein [Parasporobacterium paucivorans DSM 15970]
MKRHKKILRRIQAFVLFLVIMITTMPVQQANASDGSNQTGNTDIMRTVSLSYKLKAASEFVDLLDPYEIADSSKVEKFHAKYTFMLKDNIDELTGEENRTVKSGDYYLIDLPKELQISNPTNGSILGNDNKPIANYSFLQNADNSWQIRIVFTDYIDSPDEFEIHGEMEFDFTLDLSSVAAGTSTVVYIPIDNENNIELGITKPIPPATTPVSLTKTVSSYNNATRELVWKVNMLPTTGVFSGCIFTDTIDVAHLELKSIQHGSITLVEGVDYVFDSSTGKITYTIPNGRDGTNYKEITITTVVKRSVYGNLSATTISNRAELSGGDYDVDLDSNTASQTITPNWLGKSGTIYQGNKILWTIRANITNQAMYNAVITDRFQADVRLDKSTVKLGNTTIQVFDNAHSPANATEIYGLYTENADGTSELKIYLPRDKANAATETQTVTLVTNIVSPDTKGAQTPVYNNTASLDCNYVGDGGGEGTLPTVNLDQIGVAVPYVSVVKGHSTLTAEDKRNGTITWTIAAASNLSDYGQARIVDTLPLDQDYVAGEIYCGSQKIDATTNPKAEISPDGRTLTITYENNGALQTQQNFTVKTKIKQEIYGQNINRNFTNQVSATLFSSTTGEALVASSDTESVNVNNNVISKAPSAYNGNNTKAGQNPRVVFSITVNSNLMALQNADITDDLSKISTEFRKTGESTFSNISGVKWTYVANTLNITKSAGTRDSLDLSAITAAATYENDIININFGKNVPVNDKYIITFTAELDVSQNAIFKENGTIRCRGNVASVVADGLRSGVISSAPTNYSGEIKNEVLGKSGVHLIAEQQVLWTINLNQHKVALNNSQVVDILPKGITLDPTSIKLYKNVIGTDENFVTGTNIETQGTLVPFTYTYLPATEGGMEGRYILTVDLPDNSTEYILRFATDIDSSLLGKQVSNTAYYAGESALPENTSTSIFTLASASGGGSTTKASVTVNKMSKDNGTSLNGAMFALHWLRGGDASDPVYVRTLTETNGSVIFRGLTRGEIYTITEVAAPEGYLIDAPDPVQITVPSVGTGNVAALNFYDSPIKTGSWTPLAVKKLDGKNIVHPFNFEISEDSVSVLTGVTQNKLSNGDYSVVFSMKDGLDAENVLHFTDDHIFADTDAAGTEYLVMTKTLRMKEIPSGLAGYVYDDTIHTLVVKVYNVKGQANLKVVVEDGGGNILSDNSGTFTSDKIPVFQNAYRANGSMQFSAEKTLIGHNLAADYFSFELYEGDTLIETVKNQTGSLTGAATYSGGINFSSIPYDQSDVGTKTYTIKEKDTGLAGYTYDGAVYTVVVKITDNDNGTLSSNIESIKKTVGSVATNESSIAFTNTYTASDIDVNLTASKTLSGRTLEDQQFSFTLSQVNEDGTFIKEIGTVKNIGNNIDLPKLTFKQSDIGLSYFYKVSEVNEGNAGYTYDDSEYYVKITVLDNGDGTLRTVQTMTKEANSVTEITFDNIYQATGSAQITATKILTGKELPNEQFSFAMQQIDLLTGNSIGENSVVRNAEDGSIVFPEITYTEADAGKSYDYTISELNEGVGGYTYDPVVYTVHVSVSDNGDGTLTAQKTVSAPAGKTDITFSNTYVTSDTSISLHAEKILNGRKIENQQFTFRLDQITETGDFVNEIQEVRNDEDGMIVFDELVFTQADMGNVYYYRISEVNDNKAGYTYDESVYIIKIQIKDNNDGTLSVIKAIQKDEELVTEMLFENTYRTSDVSIQLTANKTLTGHTLAGGQFRFALVGNSYINGSDSLIEEVANNDTGKIVFAPITYTQKDMGKSFKYSLYEINDNKSGYQYDDTEYIIEVKIVDNGDGTLKADTTIMKTPGDYAVNAEDIGFANQYKAISVTAATNDDSPILWYTFTALLSLTVLLVLRKRRVRI